MSDLISRQDALDAVSDCGICIQKIVDLPSVQTGTGWTGIEDDYPASVKAVLNITAETGALETQRRVRELPPMQKTGKWIGDKCSVCGEERAWYGCNTKYCPDCGARMKWEDEE